MPTTQRRSGHRSTLIDLPLKLQGWRWRGLHQIYSKRNAHLGGGRDVRHKLQSRSQGTEHSSKRDTNNLDKTHNKVVFFSDALSVLDALLNPKKKELNVTCSHEMDNKSHHAVLSIGSKTVVGVNLGEIEFFALYHSSFIFTPYPCSFLLYSTHKCFKFCKWAISVILVDSTLRNDSKMAHFHRRFAFRNLCRAPCIAYQNKGHNLKMWATDAVV